MQPLRAKKEAISNYASIQLHHYISTLI